MSQPGGSSRFAPQNQTTHQRLSTNTVGLVALSDFRKRRAEVLEHQEREAREAAASGTSTPDRSQTATPNNATSDSGDSSNRPKVSGVTKKKKKRKVAASKLSFAGDDEEEEDDEAGPVLGKPNSAKRIGKAGQDEDKKFKIVANKSVAVVPKAVTQSALRREAAEREALRKEFLQIQEAVKDTEVAIPFVFYDGSDIPGGVVRVKKGDHVWMCLDKSRKVGANLGVGEKANARKAWARIGVDDLMLVRGSVIIPHHYEFYFFIINKTLGPGGHRLFDFTNEAPPAKPDVSESEDDDEPDPATGGGGLTTVAAMKAAAAAKALPDISTLEGANDNPSFTKVVDRRWYKRNKHIYPASTWQEFDAEKDYQDEVRRDAGGNIFFFSR